MSSADIIATISFCGHSLHSDSCINRWSNDNSVCPICRAPFTSIVLADGAIHRVLVRPLTVDEMSSIVTDADINNAITLILGESKSRGGDNTEAVSEEARGSLHVAYWGVIAAAARTAFKESLKRLKHTCIRCLEIRQKKDQLAQMSNDLNERYDNWLRLFLQRPIQLNEAHADDTWLFNKNKCHEMTLCDNNATWCTTRSSMQRINIKMNRIKWKLN